MAWEYLDTMTDRQEAIAKLIKERTKGKIVVDLNCGKAPLKKLIKCKKYIGNDIIPADFKGFVLQDDKIFSRELKKCDVLVHMGMGGYEITHEKLESPTSTESTSYIIQNLKPELVVLECITEFIPIMNKVDTFGYRLEHEQTMYLGPSRVMQRIFRIYSRISPVVQGESSS